MKSASEIRLVFGPSMTRSPAGYVTMSRDYQDPWA